MHKAHQAAKRRIIEDLLDEGMVFVTLDARYPGVEVPDHLSQDPELKLNLSYRFGMPIELNEWGVRATLSFEGAPSSCAIPWGAIYFVVSHITGRPVLFPSEMPHDLHEQVGRDAAQENETPPANRLPRVAEERPRLAVVRPDDPRAMPHDDDADPLPVCPPPTRSRQRPHLRVIK